MGFSNGKREIEIFVDGFFAGEVLAGPTNRYEVFNLTGTATFSTGAHTVRVETDVVDGTAPESRNTKVDWIRGHFQQ